MQRHGEPSLSKAKRPIHGWLKMLSDQSKPSNEQFPQEFHGRAFAALLTVALRPLAITAVSRTIRDNEPSALGPRSMP